MVDTLHALIRIAAMTAMLLVIGAIGLGRLAPGPEGRTTGSKFLVDVNCHAVARDVDGLRVLDIRDGTVRSLTMQPFERVELASGSPWVDGLGQTHVVGRWSVNGSDGTLRDAGLARLAFPSGQVLDRVSLDRYPISPPCWGTGTSARVLFASGDGSLYRYDFEPSAATIRKPLAEIRWRVDPPGDFGVAIFDLAKADGILPPDVVLASLVVMNPRNDRENRFDSQIWWLRLGPGDDEILDCGQVTPADPDGLDFGRRKPTLARRADGTLWLAYLSSSGRPNRMHLRIAPARIDERTDAPVVDARSGIILADELLNVTPTFTGGGAMLTCLSLDGGEPTAIRIPLDDVPSATALAVAGLPPGL